MEKEVLRTKATVHRRDHRRSGKKVYGQIVIERALLANYNGQKVEVIIRRFVG